MRLHILNDLHVEFGDFEPPPTDADVVVLAGDIGVGLGGLHWAATRFPDRPVVYVPGNHEFYYQDIALTEELRARAPEHVHVLDDDEIVINGTRFLGCTLWADFSLYGEAGRADAIDYARLHMPDFSLIEYQGRAFAPEDAIALHRASRDWLAARLAEPFEGSTVVVTHHAPSPQSVHPRYAGDPLTPAFASDLESLLDGQRAALWVHGHMHDSFDYRTQGTRVICNPRGYVPAALNADFRPGWAIAV